MHSPGASPFNTPLGMSRSPALRRATICNLYNITTNQEGRQLTMGSQ